MKIRFILGWIVDNTTSVINFQWNAQNSDFGHVRTYSSLHKLRNTQGKIHGTYLGNIYGIYKECITNISIDIYDITINIHKYIHQTHRPNGAAAEGGACVSDYFISQIFMDIPYMFHIYFLNIFDISISERHSICFPLCVS